MPVTFEGCYLLVQGEKLQVMWAPDFIEGDVLGITLASSRHSAVYNFGQLIIEAREEALIQQLQDEAADDARRRAHQEPDA